MKHLGKPDVASILVAPDCAACNHVFMSRIKELRLAAGLPQRAIVEAAGVDKTSVWRYETGALSALNDGARKILFALGFKTDEAMVAALAHRPARLLGDVGAGSIVTPLDDGAELLPAPPGMTQPVALRVRGTSMMPAYRPGDVLFVEDEPVTSDAILNRDCLVVTMDGRRLVKRVLPGGTPDFVSLLSYETQDLEPNVQLRSAAPVRWVQRA